MEPSTSPREYARKNVCVDGGSDGGGGHDFSGVCISPTSNRFVPPTPQSETAGQERSISGVDRPRVPQLPSLILTSTTEPLTRTDFLNAQSPAYLPFDPPDWSSNGLFETVATPRGAHLKSVSVRNVVTRTVTYKRATPNLEPTGANQAAPEQERLIISSPQITQNPTELSGFRTHTPDIRYQANPQDLQMEALDARFVDSAGEASEQAKFESRAQNLLERKLVTPEQASEVVKTGPDVLESTTAQPLPHIEALPQEHILPTLEGFKLQIQELNPKLPLYCVFRFAHDQLRRYKRLVENRVNHMKLVARAECPSRNLCSTPDGYNGRAENLPPRHFEQTDEDSAFDGIVTPAAFPEGIPLPPTKKLPARFECPICFQVKTFRKPSDWTKHVHEDVQPYSCTFPNCSEPKPFKRKADWVRHENERHRHLEWWTCNIGECNHKCYRRDNFVQHLIREHKHKTPHVERSTSSQRVTDTDISVQDQDFWNLVNACRHSTSTGTPNETCIFCGNHCASWKKLAVHVGKHFEQFALPTLHLARMRTVTKDTIDGPVELTESLDSRNDVHTFDTSLTESNGADHLRSGIVYDPALSLHAYPPSVPFSGRSEFGLSIDSGYASLRLPEVKILPIQEEHDLQSYNRPDQFDALETMTTYSDSASVETTKRDDFVQRFAELLRKDLMQQEIDVVAEVMLSDTIDELLADFAVRLGQGDPSPELRRATVFIHKYKSSITRALHEMIQDLSDEDFEEERGVSDKLPLHEIMQMWRDRENELNSDGPIADESVSIESPSNELLDPFEMDLQNYERLIVTTSAYQWLMASLRNRSLLAATGGDSISQIRATVCRHVAKPVHLSRSTPTVLTKAYFEVEWNPELIENITDSQTLDSFLTVTGSEQEAQAMTCAQYIQQTWPTNGGFLWQLTKDAILNPNKVMSDQGVDNTRISAWTSTSGLRITITGTRGAIVEAAEQLCWMGGALNSAFSTSENGILLCLPSLHFVGQSPPGSGHASSLDNSGDYGRQSSADHVRFHTSEQILAKQRASDFRYAQVISHFKVNMEYKRPDTSLQSGICWQYMFKRCVTVQGFPIQRRSKPELGLELSLELIAELVGTKYLQRFDEQLFFKQFGMMLTPSSQDGDLLIWHLCKSADGDRISYLERGTLDSCKVNYNDLSRLRHVVGWCSNIKHFVGHAAARYDVESSLLETSPPSGSLFNCQLMLGRPLSGKSNVYFSANHQPTLSSQRNYLDMFRFLERRAVLLWDTSTSRGWLVNGLRALLHLLRQSLRIDEYEDSGGMFVLKPEDLLEPKDSCSARAARKFLNNPKNMAAKISISAIRGADYEYETLSGRFERLYEIVEQAFDHQSKRRNWEQIPRSYLEGWDFLSLARRDDTISSSMATLPSIGKDWVDFIRATNAITLIGDGFGDLLQPGTAMCNPMPCDRFCLAVSVSDLPGIVRLNQCNLATRRRLISRSPLIVWHSPAGSSKRCGCVATDEDKPQHQRCVQVMWPAEQTGLLPVEDHQFALEEHLNGAVIFGHDDSLQYYLPEIGQTLIHGYPPEATKELEFIDSGIGSSLNSTGGLEKIPTRSTLSPFDDPQSTLARSDTQSNSYGNSFMSGGYGVFGNMMGNLSVNQYYFGSAPSHDASRNSAQSTSPIPQRPSSNLQEVEGVETERPLPVSQVSVPSAEDQEQDCSDIEMQQGEMEVRALGLEDYCHVFRW